MNGRVFDPVIARFLSPYPFIQNPGYTQSYNRYSYCLNNPLKYTDPSGYMSEADFRIALFHLLVVSRYGGTWTPNGGSVPFSSGYNALQSGVGYSNANGSWGSVEGMSGSSSQAYKRYFTLANPTIFYITGVCNNVGNKA